MLQNPDRHSGNFIFGSHWVYGIKHPFLIDQAANLRKGTNVKLSTKGPFNSQIINTFNPVTVKNLRKLKEEDLKKLMPFISYSEVQKIMKHKEGLLAYIDSLN